jgi:uncharacterized protein with HEPN domain
VTRGDELRRLDILEACAQLSQVVAARGSVDDEILQRAAERLLEIVGEAATNCSAQMKDRYPDVDWEGLTGLRVVLAHLYHRTEAALIWQFASADAPALASALKG